MNKNVIISVTGKQMYDHQGNGRLEFITEGKYYKKGKSYYVSYKESEVTGMEGTTTTLKISGDVVTLMRFGSVNSQLIFQKGHKHLSHYDTIYGAFTIGVFANNVDVKIDDNGGEISIGYQLDMDDGKLGENDFHMHIREIVQTCNQPEKGG